MKLSVEILAEKITDYDIDVYSLGEAVPKLEGIRFFDKELLIKDEDHLYIGYARDLPPLDTLESGVSILCIGIPADIDKHPNLNFSLIILKKQFSLGMLFNEIQELFIFFNKWESQIQELILNNSDLQKFVDISDKVMGWPISIIDRAQRSLATSQFEDSDDIIWLELRNGYIHTELLKQDRVKAADIAKYHRPMQGYSTVSNRVILSQAIRVDGHVVGFVAVHHPKPGTSYFSRGIEQLVNYFTKFVAMRMRSNEFYKLSRGMMFEYFLVDLIEKKMTDENVINDRLSFLDWKLDGYKQVLFVEMKPKFNNIQSLHNMRSQIECIIPSSRSIIYDNALVSIVSNVDDSTHIESLKARFSAWLQDNNAYCGLSNRFLMLNKTKMYYTQAKKALDFGREQDPSQQIYEYHNFVLSHIIDLLSQKIELETLFHPAFIKLLNLCKYHEFFFDTLKVYLKTERNVALCSKLLYIHRNSMIYRVKRLEEELDCDFSDFNTRSSLLISFALYDYLKAHEDVSEIPHIKKVK